MKLGHNGAPCPDPLLTRSVVVVHTNSFHRVEIQFCGCATKVEERLEYRQLLAVRLFPATTEAPATAFTFTMMDSLAALTSRGKASPYDYHEALRTLTDNCNLNGFTVRTQNVYLFYLTDH